MIEVSQIIPHIFLFTALYFENRETIKKQASWTNTRYPSVAVLVPCYNEEKTVAGTLESLLALDYPKDKLNIIVIDDGSTDRTFETIKTLLPKVEPLKKSPSYHIKIPIGIFI